MVLHDFTYKWDGKSQDGKKPVSWWPGAYHVKIVQLSSDSSKVNFLVPFVVLLKNARTHPSMNTSLRNYIYNFAQKISEQYKIEMGKTLWIEIDNTIKVIRLRPHPKLMTAALYALSWRPIRPNELDMIEPYLDDM